MELALSERLLGILRGGKSVSFKDREEVGSSTPPAKCVQTIFSGGAGCQNRRGRRCCCCLFLKNATSVTC